MRDPKRIDKVIGKVRSLWQAHPDLRLSQLLINVAGNGSSEDFFYLEDSELEAKIDAYNKGASHA